MELYLVGGINRDEILGIESKDIDYAVDMLEHKGALELAPEVLYSLMNTKLLEEGFEIFLETPDCFTTRAKFPDNHKYSGVADFVMCRKETYPDSKSRRPVVKTGTLYNDLERRDFTMNAIAKDSDGNYIDPFKGREDIAFKIIRTVKDSAESLNEDPLRFFRALRFAVTKEFDFSDDLLNALSIYNPNRFELVSSERVREELYKMLKHNTKRSLKILTKVNPEAFDYIFDNKDLWLKPTNEQ